MTKPASVLSTVDAGTFERMSDAELSTERPQTNRHMSTERATNDRPG